MRQILFLFNFTIGRSTPIRILQGIEQQEVSNHYGSIVRHDFVEIYLEEKRCVVVLLVIVITGKLKQYSHIRKSI